MIYRNKKNIDFNSVAFSSGGTFAAAACGDGGRKGLGPEKWAGFQPARS